MTLVDRIRILANQRGLSLPRLEEELNMGNGTISRWRTSTPGTNKLEIVVCGNEENTSITAMFDNLGKGASGAAVQNMNIMLGLDETVGLE